MSRRLAARALFILSIPFAICSTGWAASAAAQVAPKAGAKIEFMPEGQILPGMRGVALTVFEGTKPEPMQLEVLGIEKNATGPKGDLILVRLLGSKPEYTGVVAGMSGSPVYIDGKLVGALAFRLGEFSKEPIAGVTPIAEMMEINELDGSSGPEDAASSWATSKSDVASRTSGPGPSANATGVTQVAQPIETPLVFSGFTPEAVQAFAPQFAAAGIIPVMGAGSASDEKQPEPIEPGSSVSMVLVQGDLNIAATCTVTYADADHLLACGHAVLQFGAVDIPMNKARVIATLPSPMNSFKLVNTTEPIGAFVQDRHSGILGKFGAQPDMIPVTLSVHGGKQPREYHYQVLNNPRMGPVAIMATVFSALQSLNEYGAENSYRVKGKISVNGYPDIALQDIFAPVDAGNAPAPAMSAALMLGERFNRLFANPYARPQIKGVNLEFDSVNDRRSARLETARTDVTEARPGDEVVIEAVLKPYRGERLVRQLAVKIPTSAPQGTLRILVSDGDTLDRMRRVNDMTSLKLDLGSTISLLNKEHANNQLYVSMLEANPQAMIDDKVMPTLPASIMNVMEGMRGTQDMLVAGESSVSEASLPLDYAVSGSQVISLEIK